MESNNEVKYASFFTRLLVFLVDIFIVSFLTYIVHFVVNIEGKPIFIILILWFYFSIMISRWSTTIGGKLFGVEVFGANTSTLSFLKVSIRFFLSILPFLLYLYLRNMQHVMSPPPSPEIQMLPQLIFILIPFTMYLTKKRQMLHDAIVKSVVIDVNKKLQIGETSKYTIVGRGQQILRIIGIILVLIVGGYILIYTSVFYRIGKKSNNVYNNSFHMKYTTKDFNDSRIIFYNKELEQYSKAFVSADGMYDIFAADTKRDLALNCIQASLKEHNVSEWIEKGSSFRKNARNKYATTEETIKKAKKNEDYMGHHFYDYDLNDVNHIENELANIWDTSKNKNTCDKHLPVSELFDAFMVRYIPTREEALRNNKREFEQAKNTGMLNKSFYKKEIETTTRWLNILHAKYPNIEQKIVELKIEKAKVLQKAREKKRKEAYQRKIELAWLAAEKNNLYTGGYYRNVDLNLRNDKGQTPLMIAVKNGFINVIQQFSKGKIDVALKDNQGNTAFDYLQKHTDTKEIKLFQALKLLEIRQIIRGRAKIINSVYRDDEVLQFSIKGASCNEFHFPKQTECFTPVRVEIFRVIKSKDDRLFDELFPKVDIKLKDKRNYSLLWRAILYHNLYAIDKILEAGADIYQTDNNDHHTPLFFAVMQNNTELLKLLIKHGVNVNSKNKFGNYALSEAMFKCDNFEAIAILLDNGANPYLKNKYGKTVFDKEPVYCKNKKNIVKMKQLLKERSIFSTE